MISYEKDVDVVVLSEGTSASMKGPEEKHEVPRSAGQQTEKLKQVLVGEWCDRISSLASIVAEYCIIHRCVIRIGENASSPDTLVVLNEDVHGNEQWTELTGSCHPCQAECKEVNTDSDCLVFVDPWIAVMESALWSSFTCWCGPHQICRYSSAAKSPAWETMTESMRPRTWMNLVCLAVSGRNNTTVRETALVVACREDGQEYVSSQLALYYPKNSIWQHLSPLPPASTYTGMAVWGNSLYLFSFTGTDDATDLQPQPQTQTDLAFHNLMSASAASSSSSSLKCVAATFPSHEKTPPGAHWHPSKWLPLRAKKPRRRSPLLVTVETVGILAIGGYCGNSCEGKQRWIPDRAIDLYLPERDTWMTAAAQLPDFGANIPLTAGVIDHRLFVVRRTYGDEKEKTGYGHESQCYNNK